MSTRASRRPSAAAALNDACSRVRASDCDAIQMPAADHGATASTAASRSSRRRSSASIARNPAARLIRAPRLNVKYRVIVRATLDAPAAIRSAGVVARSTSPTASRLPMAAKSPSPFQ